MVNFPTRIPDSDFHSPALLDLFISSDASICYKMTFPPLGSSDHVVVSVSIDFLSNSNWDALFHCINYNYFRADWDGPCDHFRDALWKNIFKLCCLLQLIKRKLLFAINFSKNFNLDDSGIFLPIFSSRTNLKLHNVFITPKMVNKVITNLEGSDSSDPSFIPVVVL